MKALAWPVPLEAASEQPAFDRPRKRAGLPAFLFGAGIVLFWVLGAVLGQAHLDPMAADIQDTLSAPSAAHWFGTDQFGRDMFARVMTGSRELLLVASSATLLGVAAGTGVGLMIGQLPGTLAWVGGAVVEAGTALPPVVIALVAVSARGTSGNTLTIAYGLGLVAPVAGAVGAAVIAERGLAYVAAAKRRGESAGYILLAEILPNLLPVIAAEWACRCNAALRAVAALAFLGIGAEAPSPDWGLALAENLPLVGAGYWWMALFNGLALASLLIGAKLVAGAMQGGGPE